nr:tetratricopeptide repeat protein [uncultured Shimia sp.]
MRLFAVAVFVVAGAVAPMVQAQNAETLADIRQQLNVLYVDIQSLKRELSTTGAPLSGSSGGGSLARLDAIEAQMQQLTGKTERLEYRIQQIVDDGTNRIGDLEFRLVELEGGDVSQLGETTTLGGSAGASQGTGAGVIPPASSNVGELAVGEASDFQRAKDALVAGNYRSAADQFTAFLSAYPGSPLESEAHLRRGQAIEEQDNPSQETRALVARTYLDAYSSNMNSDVADEALYHLGRALGRLGKSNEACVTLNEVEVRHPGSEFVLQAKSEMANLGCSL